MAAPSRDARLKSIVDMLKRENGLPIQTMADRLGVSHMTIRRDLEILAQDEQVRLMHGGALLNPAIYSVGSDASYSLIAAGSVNAGKKRAIGDTAVTLLEDGDVLIIDSGSTTEWIARYLPEELNLTVLSYALNIVAETAKRPRCRSVFAGGSLHQNLLMFESPEGIDLIKRFRATKAFVSAAGVSEQFGVTCANAYERATKRAVIESAAQRILTVDSTKFDVIRSDHFANLSEFQVVVTDANVATETRRALQDLGLEVLIAGDD